MENLHNLARQTLRLIEYTERAATRYEMAKETGESGDFFSEVKPFADLVKQEADSWKVSAVEWIINNQPKNIHSRQIEATAENIELVSVQAFFPETGRKRFMGYIQSIHYVLDSLLTAVNQFPQKAQLKNKSTL
ncbi:YppE family protein [Mesobacillus zeae]|uniref:DUF1798 family protein n=1 Tax=Mesobacillus zeae TaxID=1917180 RepID=A0A398B3Q4_9BACI|nr:YppE family protein [Mesobacillus zeae]RID84211.1 DUF1798 family protein [Mesobacillus zeae]